MRWFSRLPPSSRASWWGLILLEHDTEPTELRSAATKLVIGVVLLAPGRTFALGPAYAAIDVAPEWAWGTLFLSVGIVHVAAIRDGHHAWRRWAALFGFLTWFSFAVNFLLVEPVGFLGWFLLVQAASQGWVWLRLARPSP